MKARIRFFSVLRSLVTEEEVERDFPDEATVVDLLDSLYSDWPELRKWDEQILIAVDREYAQRSTPLFAGREAVEVAIMPPVQGG